MDILNMIKPQMTKSNFIKNCILLTSLLFLNNCVYGLSRNVDPSSYPEAKSIGGSSLYMRAVEGVDSKENQYGVKYFYNPYLKDTEIQKGLPRKDDLKSGCYIDVDLATMNSYGQVYYLREKKWHRNIVGKAYSFIAGLSLYTIPYYEPVYFDTKIYLRSFKDNEILKTYEYQDKYYLMVTSFSYLFVVPFMSNPFYDNIYGVMNRIRENIKEANLREVTNDVGMFAECS